MTTLRRPGSQALIDFGGNAGAPSVAALALPHAQSPLGHITVSVGVVSVLPGQEQTPERLVALADEALYQAKAQGRNRVVLATS